MDFRSASTDCFWPNFDKHSFFVFAKRREGRAVINWGGASRWAFLKFQEVLTAHSLEALTP